MQFVEVKRIIKPSGHLLENNNNVIIINFQPRNSLELQTVPEDQMMEIPRSFIVSVYLEVYLFHSWVNVNTEIYIFIFPKVFVLFD